MSLTLLALELSADKSSLRLQGQANLQTGQTARVNLLLKTAQDLPMEGRKVELVAEPMASWQWPPSPPPISRDERRWCSRPAAPA
ncbi:MAG: hypothetical protein QF569_21000 [Candidatus Poribacteria bacterium]|nr:hypothetical protein [Candidatus Poribacteria bacterium]